MEPSPFTNADLIALWDAAAREVLGDDYPGYTDADGIGDTTRDGVDLSPAIKARQDAMARRLLRIMRQGDGV